MISPAKLLSLLVWVTLASLAACGDNAGEPSCEDGLVWDDDFIALAPEDLETVVGYQRISGDLTISGSVQAVSALGCLEKIDGLLYLSQGELSDLTGLSNLRELGGLYVSQMPSLSSLRGLESVGVLSSLTIQLAGVEDLLGLNGLEEISGRLHLHEGLFPDMRGLENLRSIGGSLSINGFMTPFSLDGLTGLQTIGGSVDVQLNAGLTSMSGLTQLRSVGGQFRVVDNAVLRDFELPQLASLGGPLTIRNNESLPNCRAIELRDQLVDAGWTGEATIGSNSDQPCP